MRYPLLLSACAAIALLSLGCEGRSGRPGGPQNPMTSTRDRGVSNDAEESGDAGDDPFDAFGDRDFGFEERDAETGQDFGFPDAGFRDAESPPDFGFPDQGFPDAFAFDAMPPRDSGIGPDAFVPDFGVPPFDSGTPVDAGPPAFQTTVSVTASQLILSGGNTEYTATFNYDNIGPGSQTISVVTARVDWIQGSLQTFSLAPSSHVASVGSTQRNVATVPGSQSPPVDVLFEQFVCALGITTVYLEFSNGQTLTELTTLQCPP